MPIYDYVCSSCGQRTEVIHGINGGTPRFCPACGAEGTLKKGFTTPAIHFKGSGWAKKDRAAMRTPRSSKPADAGDSGSSSSSASGSSSSSSSGEADSTSTTKPDGGSSSKPAAGGGGGD